MVQSRETTRIAIKGLARRLLDEIRAPSGNEGSFFEAGCTFASGFVVSRVKL